MATKLRNISKKSRKKSIKKSSKKSIKRSKKNSKKYTKKKSIQRRRRVTRKKYQKGGAKEIKLAIILITSHGNLDNLDEPKTHNKDINVYKINATKPGVCNYVHDEELEEMGKKLSEFINSKKEKWLEQKILKTNNELNLSFKTEKQKDKELEKLTNSIRNYLPKIDEVHKDVKKVAKSKKNKKGKKDSDFFDSDDDKNEDFIQYEKNIGETYSIAKWKKNDEYNNKTYTIHLDERDETNSNPYNNTIIILGEPGMPQLDLIKFHYNLRNMEDKEKGKIKEEIKKLDKKKKEKQKKKDKQEEEQEEEQKNDSEEESEEELKGGGPFFSKLQNESDDEEAAPVVAPAIKEVEEREKVEEDVEEAPTAPEEKIDGNKEESISDEESIKSDEIDTNKYTTLNNILRELTKKGYTDTIIIDLSCAVGPDERSSRILRREEDGKKYGGN